MSAKVVFYTKSRCPYCDRAKELLQRKGADVEEISMDHRPDEYAALKSRTGWMTLPQIFIGETFIGGYDDLAELERQNRLDEMLKG